MVALLGIPHWWWHPLTGNGYQWWSGIGSDIAELSIAVAIVTAAVGAYHKHECHVEQCHRLAWHPDPDHGHPVCKRHHPDSGLIVQHPTRRTSRRLSG